MSKEDKKVIPAKSAVGTIIFGLFTLFVVFGLIGGWMFYAPLASSSVAIGTVSADLEKKTVQHLEGGIVEEILVKDGDFVKKGDILLRLGNRKVKGNMEIEKQQYLEFLALETRLKAQRDEQRGIAFPSKLTSLEHKPKIRELLDGQRQVFRARERIVVSTKEITEEQISQLRRQKEGIQYSIDSKNLRLSSLNEELIEWEDLYAQQLIDKLKLRDVSREKIALEGDIASSESKLSEIDVRISELRATSIFREKEFQEKILSELVGVQAKLSTLKSTIFMAKDTMKKTVVKAPISGTIIEMEIHTIGGVVGSGTPLLKIVPKDSKLLVVAEVKTTDIDKVSVGQLADIRFSAFNTQNTHVLEGKIIHASADVLLNKTTGMNYYEAKIELTKAGQERLKEYEFKLVAGMPAEVMIRLEDRTVVEYLIKPFKDMLSRAFNEE